MSAPQMCVCLYHMYKEDIFTYVPFATMLSKKIISRTFNLSCYGGLSGTNTGENTATGAYRFNSVACEMLMVNVATIKRMVCPSVHT